MLVVHLISYPGVEGCILARVSSVPKGWGCERVEGWRGCLYLNELTACTNVHEDMREVGCVEGCMGLPIDSFASLTEP